MVPNFYLTQIDVNKKKKKEKKLPDIDTVNFTHRNDEYSNGIAAQLMRIAHAQEYSKRTKNIPLMNDDPRTCDYSWSCSKYSIWRRAHMLHVGTY